MVKRVLHLDVSTLDVGHLGQSTELKCPNEEISSPDCAFKMLLNPKGFSQQQLENFAVQNPYSNIVDGVYAIHKRCIVLFSTTHGCLQYGSALVNITDYIVHF